MEEEEEEERGYTCFSLYWHSKGVSLSEKRCSCCCCWHVNCIFDFEGTFCFLLFCFCIQSLTVLCRYCDDDARQVVVYTLYPGG